MHEKGDKQIVEILQTSPLFTNMQQNSIKINSDSIMKLLNENKLLCHAQSCFIPSDSWECQMLLIFYDIYKSFDCNPPLEVGETFLDISKAFDRVWHDELTYKIKSSGIWDTPLKLIWKFFSKRC